MTVNERIEEILKGNKDLKRGSDEEFSFTRIPFGIPVLDKLAGGGIPKKKMTIFTGQSNAGKTYLAMKVAVQVQKDGGIVAWVDTEMTWDAKWAEACGIDTDNIIVYQPTTGEEAFDTLEILFKSSVDLVVLDSIAGLVPANLMNEDFSYTPMAWQARFVNSSLPRIFPHLKLGSAFIAINQVRQSLGPVSFVNMPGGIGQNFYAHSIFELKRNGWIEEEKVKVGFDISIRLRKTKVGGKAFQAVDVPFRLEGGIDMIEVLIRDALNAKTIEQRGAWYNMFGEKYQGSNSLRAAILADSKLQEKLEMETYKN